MVLPLVGLAALAGGAGLGMSYARDMRAERERERQLGVFDEAFGPQLGAGPDPVGQGVTNRPVDGPQPDPATQAVARIATTHGDPTTPLGMFRVGVEMGNKELQAQAMRSMNNADLAQITAEQSRMDFQESLQLGEVSHRQALGRIGAQGAETRRNALYGSDLRRLEARELAGIEAGLGPDRETRQQLQGVADRYNALDDAFQYFESTFAGDRALDMEEASYQGSQWRMHSMLALQDIADAQSLSSDDIALFTDWSGDPEQWSNFTGAEKGRMRSMMQMIRQDMDRKFGAYGMEGGAYRLRERLPERGAQMVSASEAAGEGEADGFLREIREVLTEDPVELRFPRMEDEAAQP